jgi:hypothetical protein
LLGVGCSAIVERYAPARVGPHSFSGVRDPVDVYVVGRLLCSVRLRPPKVTAVTNTGGNFFATLSGAYPPAAGWTYQSAVRRLSRNTIEIKTYDAQAEGGAVGADAHFRYVPTAADPRTDIHWVQVVTDNHNVTNNPGHGNAENVVDTPSRRGTPYYDDGALADSGACAAGCNFYDKPRRADPAMDHGWDAVLFLVQGPAPAAAPGNVLLLRPGLSWGWENSCVAIEIPRFRRFWHLLSGGVLRAERPLAPGETTRLHLDPPAIFQAEHDGEQARAELSSLQLTLAFDPPAEPSLGPQSDLWRFAVTGGEGAFGSASGHTLGEISFHVREGTGAVQPADWGFSAEVQLEMRSTKGEPFTATFWLYGRLDAEGTAVSLGPGTQLLQDD